ncbi:MAG: class I SAM-dependent methyltransferase [Steroidobacteraceae bacterium]
MAHAKKSMMALLALSIALTACATAGSTRTSTAADLDRILAGDQRSEANRARDVYRHPKETLLFFGIRPEQTVLEVWPGGGWYTEIIAPLVAQKGKYYAAQFVPNPESKGTTAALKAYADKLAARPDLYGNVTVTAMGPGSTADIAPPGSVDLIVTFRNIHNWMGRDYTPAAFAAMYKALKPGGTLGVAEHRGNPAVTQDPKAKSGYVNEDYAIRMIEAAGFRLVAKSEVNANPKDTRDHEKGVWTLPPTYALGDTDRAKYAAIGESDRFTLKFIKPSAP